MGSRGLSSWRRHNIFCPSHPLLVSWSRQRHFHILRFSYGIWVTVRDGLIQHIIDIKHSLELALKAKQESWGIGLENKPRLMHLESTNGYLQKSTDFIERLATAPSAAVPPVPRRNLQCPWTKNPIRFGYIEDEWSITKRTWVSFKDSGSKCSLDLHAQYAQSVSLRSKY